MNLKPARSTTKKLNLVHHAPVVRQFNRNVPMTSPTYDQVCFNRSAPMNSLADVHVC